MNTIRRGLLLCLLLAATAGCDRVTKHFAVRTLAGSPSQSFLADTLRLDYHENPGAFLGVGSTWRPEIRSGFFLIGNAFFLLATAGVALRFKWSRLARVGFALFFAGAASNLIDRVALGSVIDFLNIGLGQFRTGIFNVADVAIMAGVAILLLEGYRSRSAKLGSGLDI
jgi:signal peptidase II